MSATMTAAKPMDLPESPTLTHDDFLKHMQGMLSHYTAKGATPTKLYALPLHAVNANVAALHTAPAAKVNTTGKTAVDNALKTGQANTTKFAQNQKTAVMGAQNKLAQSHDTDAFSKQMQQLEAQAQQQAHDNIHQQFQDLINIGTQHPEQQQRILSLTNQIGAFFTNLLANVGAFFKKIAAQIISWIKSAVDWIKGAAASVENWVSGAVSSIGHFFSSLF